MDKKTNLILRELDINARQSNSRIAKNVGLKKETVNYIIKKLEKNKVIQGYFTLTNYFKLGLNIFKLLIRYENIGEKGESQLLDWLSKQEEVVWIGKAEGKWDLIITLRQKQIEKMYSLLEIFNKKFSKNIKEKQLLLAYELMWFNEKYLLNDSKNYYSIVLNPKDGIAEIDDIDEKIILLLENNSRIPIIEIAKEIRLTAQAIAKRIKILLKKGVIVGFKLRTNLASLDKGYHHIFISLRDFSKIDEIVSYYKSSKNCVFIMKYHGSYDLHLEWVSDSQNNFREIIRDFREKFGDYVSDYSQLTILEESKLVSKK
ncbi:MAG: Lrp/AsnC family transcriptional regulator [Candidatus Nanoarchaeia archaeon]